MSAVSALWESGKKNFEADPSEAAGYVVGTIGTSFLPDYDTAWGKVIGKVAELVSVPVTSPMAR